MDARRGQIEPRTAAMTEIYRQYDYSYWMFEDEENWLAPVATEKYSETALQYHASKRAIREVIRNYGDDSDDVVGVDLEELDDYDVDDYARLSLDQCYVILGKYFTEPPLPAHIKGHYRVAHQHRTWRLRNTLLQRVWALQAQNMEEDEAFMDGFGDDDGDDYLDEGIEDDETEEFARLDDETIAHFGYLRLGKLVSIFYMFISPTGPRNARRRAYFERGQHLEV